jgi:type II pantothenate kinase
MKIGIDFGATTTDIVAINKKGVVKGISFPAKKKYGVETLIRKLGFYREQVHGGIFVTGGKSSLLKKYKHIDEIKAIGTGGSFLAKKKKCLVASLGTGTCIVNVNNKKIEHFGGSGVGGGTVLGLNKLLCNTNTIKDINNLAKYGNLENIDITVKDIIGSGIGKVPANSTASNFGNINRKNAKNTDKTLAVCSMVGQSLAMLLIFTAKATKQKHIVLTGKLTEVKPVIISMKKVAKIYKKEFIIPKYAGIATAIGATIHNK